MTSVSGMHTHAFTSVPYMRGRYIYFPPGTKTFHAIRKTVHVSDPGEGVKGEELSRKHWTTLNRLRTGVGRYRYVMKKWGLADSAACECGGPEQTTDHIINSCPLHRPPSEAGLFEVGPLTRAWLQQTELNI